jgi:Ser/Thr protein kinase RdoA (MazF antagonist)
MPGNSLTDFSHLSPDLVLQLVEQTVERRCSNLCRPLNSYINRVYDVQMDDGTWTVVKFYRPGRWSRDALQDEQDFLAELQQAEVPVIAPLAAPDGKLLHEYRGTYFALFPKRGGRPLDEPSDAQWKELGRLLARVHAVGAQRAPRDRIHIHPRRSSAAHLEEILAAGFPHPGVAREFESVARGILDLIAPLFDGVPAQRVHGDCHGANILNRPGEPLFLIDFDDMAVGPPVQDLWMLLPGHSRASRRELDLVLEGYETLRDFDRTTLRLIEPLRAMRFLHFTAWCAHQKLDGGFARMAPDWGSNAFWRQEISDLERQRQEITDELDR